jgi:serine/threonine protein kinase
MELCEATLDDYCGGKYHEPVPSEMNGLIQMASGLCYLHSKQIIHRDLKATNVLIACKMFKLSDFGLVAPSVEDGEYSRPPGARVDNYRAAELWRFRRLEMDAISRQQMELSADVFAMGCIFYFYLTRGSNPFGQEPIIAVKIINGESDLTGKLNVQPKYFERKSVKSRFLCKKD